MLGAAAATAVDPSASFVAAEAFTVTARAWAACGVV